MLSDEDIEAMELLMNVEQFSSQLSEWEVGFIESIYDQETLTPKQRKKFEEIWERVSQ
jgi:hypothetical protein